MRPLLLLLLLPATSARSGFDHEHATWTQVLADHVRDGRVDYEALLGDRAGLASYLGELEAVGKDELRGFTRDQRFAFWINAYNAYTVKLILDHYPVASIRKIGGLFKSPFKIEFIPLRSFAPEPISLDTIEHEILRKEFADARLHASIVCAARSCPKLASRAYRAADLEQHLDQAMRGFLADSERNRWRPESSTLELSPIFKWFREDFEKSAGSLAAFVRRYAPPAMAKALEAGSTPDIEYTDYDWSLNDR